MIKEQAKIKIQDLISKYEAVKVGGKIGKYTEEETKKDFIAPMFEALGWNVFDRNEVTAEEQISGDRVDYGFYLNGRIKFYLEAKSLKADLLREDYAKQAIRYSWNKGVTWAVLTDFEGLIVFNALSPEKSLAGKKYLSFSYEEYLTRFDELWRLSRIAFSDDILDKEAEKVGKKLQKISVTETLAKDLNECREILTNAFIQWNEKVDPHLIDEGVQKLLNRLIFIRSAEDRKIEPPTLMPLIHEYKASGKAGQVSPYQAMIKKFRELDETYNSNLFDEHPFEKWEEFGGATEKVIDILYGKKNYFEYDFSVIPADVLGNVYENYLGHQLKKSKAKESSGKNLKKRKEQGIYYTPKFIVDYIVKNALGPVLDKCKSVNDLQKIKILDPACGSGSFLVAAMNFLIKKYEEFGAKPDGYLKIQILQNNIYGVDLDQQAVELARLNLLLNTFDSQTKLPGLENNIKNGNSLISGTDEELKKYFGKNYRDKNPFNWEEEFPEVFSSCHSRPLRQSSSPLRRVEDEASEASESGNPGFDVIIGNPPWGANIDKDAEYLAFKYPESTKAHKDTYKIFIDLAIQKLKNSGRLGFVSPNTFLYQPRYQDIKDLLDKYNYTVLNLGENIFGNVQLPCCVLVVEKEKGDEHIVIDLTKTAREELPSAIINTTPESAAKASAVNTAIIKNTGLTFDEVFLLKDGGVKHQRTNIGKADKGKNDLRERIYYSGKLKDNKDYPLLIGSDINRYIIFNKPTFNLRANYKSLLGKDEIVYFDKKMMAIKRKIVWRQTADQIKAVIIGEEWFANTLQCAVIKENYLKKVDLLYALAIFNSKYIDFIYRQKVLETGKVFPQVKLKYLRDLPFVIGAKSQQKKIIELARKMLALNKKLRQITENSDQWHKVKDEIAKTDKKIDEEVYRLYGLKEEEIKIIEL
ncbi:MAG: N-6 DNA methylase [bacterium]|nr:N-6 DNA methylase [bacterium]